MTRLQYENVEHELLTFSYGGRGTDAKIVASKTGKITVIQVKTLVSKVAGGCINHQCLAIKIGLKQRKSFEIFGFRSFYGGDKRDRTADLLNAIPPLAVY